MDFLRINNLTKKWQPNLALAVDNVSFRLPKNQFIALLGPSGCGKSTILNMIAGLATPTSGNVFINGKDVTHLPPGKRQLSMVFQSYALFPHLSVKDNILFGLKARKVAKTECEKRLDQALSLVNLTQEINKKPSQLSGGQRQRVALARAIVAQAPLCLMDEPLSNLDAKLRQEMRTEIRALQQKLALSVLYVTHDQVEAMSMADEIILLNNGKIVQQAKPAQLYQQPENLFAATFVGNPPMNILSTQQPDTLLGIRPEHIVLNPSIDAYPISVISTDYHGADTLINAELRGQKLKMSLAGHHEYAANTQLAIALPESHCHYFNADSGKAIVPLQPLSHFISTATKE